MIDKLLSYERSVFFFLNGSDSIYLDHFMWLFSTRVVWLPLAAFILFVFFYKKKLKEVVILMMTIVLVITLCDQFASHFCKPFFTSFRPTHHPDFMEHVDTVFGYRGGRYGFISSHAANAMGAAMFMSLLFRDKLFCWTIYIWAILTAYSRVYLGVHFITDIFFGTLAGLIIGFSVYHLYVYIRPKILGNDIPEPEELYTGQNKRAIVYGIWINIILMLIFNYLIVSFIQKFI